MSQPKLSFEIWEAIIDGLESDELPFVKKLVDLRVAQVIKALTGALEIAPSVENNRAQAAEQVKRRAGRKSNAERHEVVAGLADKARAAQDALESQNDGEGLQS